MRAVVPKNNENRVVLQVHALKKVPQFPEILVDAVDRSVEVRENPIDA